MPEKQKYRKEIDLPQIVPGDQVLEQMSTRRWVSLLMIIASFICIAVLYRDNSSGLRRSDKLSGAHFDEQTYYMPTIARLEEKWPRVSLSDDSVSATPPGYTYLLASIAKLIGSDPNVLRNVHVAIASILLLQLGALLIVPRDSGAVWIVIVPCALSPTVVRGGAFVTTDIPALVAVAGAFVALQAQLRSPRRLYSLLFAICSSLAVLIRQNTAWIIGPGLMALFLMRGSAEGDLRVRLSMALAFVPGALALFTMYRSWGGPVPPQWHSAYEMSAMPAMYILSLSGFLLWPVVVGLTRAEELGEMLFCRSTLVVGLLSAGLGIAIPSSYNHEAGRWGGVLWTLASNLPTVAERSVLFVAGAFVGGVILWLVLRLLLRAHFAIAMLWAAAYSAWVLTNFANRFVFQRYYEPYILFFGVAAVAVLLHDGGRKIKRSWPFLAVSAIQGILLAASFMSDGFSHLRR